MSHHKLTITVHDDVYAGLHEHIGRGKISQFIEQLVKPYVLKENLESSYLEMKADVEREAEAEIWSENLLQDLNDEKR